MLYHRMTHDPLVSFYGGEGDVEEHVYISVIGCLVFHLNGLHSSVTGTFFFMGRYCKKEQLYFNTENLISHTYTDIYRCLTFTQSLKNGSKYFI